MRRCNKAVAADFFGVSLPTLDVWIRRGMPVIQRGSRGVPWELDLLEITRWKFSPGEVDAVDNPSTISPKDRLDYWRAERERARHQTEQGELVPVFEVEQRFARLSKSLVQAIETFPDRAEREPGVNAEVIILLQSLGNSLREILYVAANENDSA